MLQRQNNKTFFQTSYPYRGGLFESGRVPDLYAASIGTMRSETGFLCDQITAGTAVHVVREGIGTVNVDGTRYEMNGGDVFVFFKDQHIRHYDHESTPWQYEWVMLAGERTEWALARCGITRDSPHLPGRAMPRVRAHTADLLQTYRHGTHTGLFPVTWAWHLLYLLDETPPRSAEGTDTAEACRAIIEGEYYSALSVSDIAIRLGVERTTLFRHFKRMFRVSPKDYLDGIRLERSARMLKESRLRVKEIAAACGFAGENYFCRVFRKKFGVSPGRWRG